MTIKPASLQDVMHVALNMRDGDFAEFSATSFSDDREALADRLAARYGGRNDVLCGFADGMPVCIGGTIETWPNVVSLLFFATDNFQRIGLGVTRFIRKELLPRYFDKGIHRVQAISHADHHEAHKWLRVLGLKQEAVFPEFGKSGENFIQFAKVSG